MNISEKNKLLLEKIFNIEQFCRINWKYTKERQERETPINMDYTDGRKDALREIVEKYFGEI